MAKKATRRGKRYSEAQKQQILAAAEKEGLTGAQVRKRFGVSTLTFYRWRGPVGSGRRGGSTRAASGPSSASNAGIRDQVRQTVQQILPDVIRAEVNDYLDGLFSRPRRRRPRKSA